jgi:hypothetical protein
VIVVVVVVFRESLCRAWRRSAPLLAARVLRGPADCALQNARTSKEMSIVIKNSTVCSDSAPTTLISTNSICSINETSIQETLNALNDVVRSGEVRYLGASNLRALQLMKAIGFRRAKGGATFVSIQNYLLNRDE